MNPKFKYIDATTKEETEFSGLDVMQGLFRVKSFTSVGGFNNGDIIIDYDFDCAIIFDKGQWYIKQLQYSTPIRSFAQLGSIIKPLLLVF